MSIKSLRYMAEYKKTLKIKELKLLWRYTFHSAINISRLIIVIKMLLTLQELKRRSLIFKVESKKNETKNSCFIENETYKKIRVFEFFGVLV